MKKEKDIETRKLFADRIVKAEVEAPMQRVVQPTSNTESVQQTEKVKLRTKSNEVQLNVHVDADLIKQLKLKGVSEDKNIKEMISEAIRMYLSE